MMLLGLLALGQTVAGQEIRWSDWQKANRGNNYFYIIGQDETGIYVRRQMSTRLRTRYELVRYSHAMVREKATPLALELEGKQVELHDELLYNGQLLLLTTYINLQQKARYLFVQTVDKQSMTVSAKPRLLATMDFEDGSRNREGEFAIRVAPDSSHLMVVVARAGKKKAQRVMTYHVFDRNLDMLWKKSVTYEFANAQLNDISLRVDRRGYAWLMVGIGAADEDDETPDTYQVYQYRPDATITYRLDHGGNDLQEMNITLDQADRIVIWGLYREVAHREKQYMTGVCTAIIDAETAPTVPLRLEALAPDALVHAFAPDKWTKSRNEKRRDKGKDYQYYWYALRGTQLLPDGGMLIHGEKWLITRHNKYNNSTYYEVNRYNYHDFIAMRLSASGKIEWVRSIPKRQRAGQSRGSWASYACLPSQDKLRFCFNGPRENLNWDGKGQPEYFWKMTGAVAMYVEVDADGNVSPRKALFDGDLNFLFRTYNLEPLGPDRALQIGQRYKKYRVGTAAFGE